MPLSAEGPTGGVSVPDPDGALAFMDAVSPPKPVDSTWKWVLGAWLLYELLKDDR